MGIIHLTDGEKGGVGKSFFARALAQYHLDKQIKFVCVEADRSNPTLRNVYKDICKGAAFSEDEKLADSPDKVFDLALSQSVIVNFPAQVHRAFFKWFQTKGLSSLAKEHGVIFCKWWVSDGEDDSINLFLESLKQYDSAIPHIFVKNWGRCDEWGFFQKHQAIQDAIKQSNIPVIDFPKLGDARRVEINALRLTFDEARKHEPFGIIGRNQISTFLNQSYAALESTGLFAPANSAPKKAA